MPFFINKIVNYIIIGLIHLIPAGKSISSLSAEAGNYSGYRDIIFYNGKRLAVGTGGRIDYISSSGVKTAVVNTDRNDLNCVSGRDQVVVAAGDKGTILFSSDGKLFSRAESGTDKNINGITFKNDLLIAVATEGTILVSKNGKSWSSLKSKSRGNIVSVTSNDSFFIGVTDQGEILKSNDGFNWEVKDYNKEYSGYNKSCLFKKVIAANNRIFIIGRHEDNSPAVLFSSLGNVWTERSLIYNDDHGMVRFLENEPNGITYDPVRDQFILACNKGEIFILPSCTRCNASAVVSASDLYGINCTGNLLIVVGRDFTVNILNL